MKFKDAPAGLFRNTDGIVYSKLSEQVTKEEKSFNAVLITNGKLVSIDSVAEVEGLTT